MIIRTGAVLFTVWALVCVPLFINAVVALYQEPTAYNAGGVIGNVLMLLVFGYLGVKLFSMPLPRRRRHESKAP